MQRQDKIDLVSSRVYPGLERKPGGPDNWVEKAGGLPDYIERIAKHLHYEQGMTISRSIAVAVNTVKRWARGGTVTEHGTTKHITPKTQALAAKALAEWNAKKAKAKMDLGVEPTREEKIAYIDLALTKDGRKSFKRQGKWKHGFIPVDGKAKVAKAKGSPIAMKRMNRLFGDGKPTGTQDIKSTGSNNSEKVARAAQTRRTRVAESSLPTQRVASSSAEHSRGGGKVKRSSKPWAEIPEAQKVTRNGKRYVMSVYQGKTMLVQWTGDQTSQKSADTAKRVLVSIRPADAQRMTTAQLRRALKVPGQPASVKKALNKALQDKIRKEKATV